VRIESIGYVQLCHQYLAAFRFEHHFANVVMSPHEVAYLMHKAMEETDIFRGSIIQSYIRTELQIPTQRSSLMAGWSNNNDLRRHHNREDSQPSGGTGRYSGLLVRS
jgi:hypothetical protein